MKMSTHAKMAKEKGKTATQSKLSDFGRSPEPKTSKETAGPVEEDANAKEASSVPRTPAGAASELRLVKEEILKAVGDLKNEFKDKLNDILKAAEETTKQLADCTSRIGEAEERISAVEDECCVLKGKVEELDKRNKALEDKLVDMETRSRLNNIRVVGLPEGAEGLDPCSFLECWLADALDMGPLRSRATGDPPRPLIMRFLNYKQKVAVMNAARKKGDIRYKNINVRLYNDLATEVHKQRKQYDAVHAQLQRLGLRHGFRPPTKLLVTYKERTHTFDNESQVQECKNSLFTRDPHYQRLRSHCRA
uniref:L1 transposable element RRM domain-containing protein n=1 Tax=Oryzias latipes TaxID=8090 RepID=A0A3P9INR8_ORYLA